MVPSALDSLLEITLYKLFNFDIDNFIREHDTYAEPPRLPPMFAMGVGRTTAQKMCATNMAPFLYGAKHMGH
jgi:hypothetical protein